MASKPAASTYSSIPTSSSSVFSSNALSSGQGLQSSTSSGHLNDARRHIQRARQPAQGHAWQAVFNSSSQSPLPKSLRQHQHQQPHERQSRVLPSFAPSVAFSGVPESDAYHDGVSTNIETEGDLPSSTIMSRTNERDWLVQEARDLSGGGAAWSMAPDSGGDIIVIMAIQIRGHRVGCAYYDGDTSKLWVLEVLNECTSLDLLEMIKAQVRPNLILASSKTEEQALNTLKTNDIQQQTKVEIRPNAEFMYDVAKSKLLSLVLSPGFRRRDTRPRLSHQGQEGELVGIDPLVSADDYRRRQGLIDLSNMIDLDNVDSVGSAGALLSYLSRTKALHAANNLNRAIVLDLAMFSLDSFMYINTNGLSSLQIFEDESHPNVHSSVNGRKEGLSLFGILNNTRTPQGRHLLKQWFLRPSLDLSIIESRQLSIKCFVKPENQPIMDQIMGCLSRIKNIPRVLQAMHRKALLKDWQGIIQFACYSLKIYSLCHELYEVESPVVLSDQQIRQFFQVQELNEVGSLINDVVDFDESVTEGRCVVKPNVDEELDRMRQTYQGLGSFLSEVAKDISKTIPSHFASTINVVYFPQLGYLITVPMNPNWKKEEDFYLDGLSYQFCTERAVYYKNNATRELDEHLGDIHGLIVDREIDILQTLQERIIEYSHLLILCSDLCAELDALLSLAQAAKHQCYTRPIMSDQTILHIVNGRHPLQELCVESFVPNDTMLGEYHHVETATVPSSNSSIHEATATRSLSFCPHCPSAPATIDNNNVMILCGPNCSGKSVYLKQVAMITFMAHIGSFVPADHALIGLTDKILTRLQTRETVSKVHSTFMTDLSQVSLALRMATQRSLVVLDEFGKGTATADGAGLLCGVIEHFASMAAHQRPRVLATTHFHELFENQLMRIDRQSGVLLASNNSHTSSGRQLANQSGTNSVEAVPPISSQQAQDTLMEDSSTLASTQPLPISIYTMEALFDQAPFVDNTDRALDFSPGNGTQREPTFLFKVRQGRYPLSLGTVCAATSGLPQTIVQRSVHLSHLFRRYDMVVPDLGPYDEIRFEMYEHLIHKLLQLKFGSDNDQARPHGEQGMKSEEKTSEFKIEPELWMDIEALMEYAGQVEAFEKGQA